MHHSILGSRVIKKIRKAAPQRDTRMSERSRDTDREREREREHERERERERGREACLEASDRDMMDLEGYEVSGWEGGRGREREREK